MQTITPKPIEKPAEKPSEKIGIDEKNKSVFDAISKNINSSTGNGKKVDDTLTELQTKIPLPQTKIAEAKKLEDMPTIEIAGKKLPITTPPTEIEITEKNIKCRQCHKVKPSDEFKSDISGKTIKTCSACRNKGVIKNPREIFTENMKNSIEGIVKKVESMETNFNRTDCIKKLTDIGNDPKTLEKMTDDDLKKLRSTACKTALEKITKIDETIFDIGIVTAGAVEGLPLESWYGVSLEGLVDQLMEDREKWLQIIRLLLDEYPEIIQQLTPGKQAALLGAITLGKIIIKNAQKKKLMNQNSGSGKSGDSK